MTNRRPAANKFAGGRENNPPTLLPVKDKAMGGFSMRLPLTQIICKYEEIHIIYIVCLAVLYNNVMRQS